MIAGFNILGDLAYLSHAETLRFFQRACVRTDIDLAYSQGFNPRPKMSLPLPRTVGVGAYDETLCLKVNTQGDFNLEEFRNDLQTQLPKNIELTKIKMPSNKVSFNSGTAVYEFSLRSCVDTKELWEKINELMKLDSIEVKRQGSPKRKARTIDIKPYLKSFEIKENMLSVTCAFTPGGSVRIDEIISLIGLDFSKLSGPILRKNVQWND